MCLDPPVPGRLGYQEVGVLSPREVVAASVLISCIFRCSLILAFLALLLSPGMICSGRNLPMQAVPAAHVNCDCVGHKPSIAEDVGFALECKSLQFGSIQPLQVCLPTKRTLVVVLLEPKHHCVLSLHKWRSKRSNMVSTGLALRDLEMEYSPSGSNPRRRSANQDDVIHYAGQIQLSGL